MTLQQVAYGHILRAPETAVIGGYRRGFKEEQAKQVATWICDILDNMGDDAVIERVQSEVVALCEKFPVYA